MAVVAFNTFCRRPVLALSQILSCRSHQPLRVRLCAICWSTSSGRASNHQQAWLAIRQPCHSIGCCWLGVMTRRSKRELHQSDSPWLQAPRPDLSPISYRHQAKRNNIRPHMNCWHTMHLLLLRHLL